MTGRLTWGGAVVTGLAGFATGLLVAALLVAGRTPPRPAEFSGPALVDTPARPVTVTVTGPAPPASTVTERLPGVPETTTRYVEVTVPPTSPPASTTTSTTPASTTKPWQY